MLITKPISLSITLKKRVHFKFEFYTAFDILMLIVNYFNHEIGCLFS